MKKLHELKADRASKIKEQDVMVQLIKKEDRKFTEDEGKRFDALQVEFDVIAGDIAEAEKVAAHEKRMAGLAGSPVGEPKKVKKEEDRFSFLGAIRNVVNRTSLSDTEQKMHEEASDELRKSGISIAENDFAIPSTMMRAQTVTADAGAKGAALVGTDISVVQPLEPQLTIAALGATPLTGLVGNVSLPTSGSFTMSYVAETADVTATDVAFSGPTLKPKRLSGVVEISKQLLLQGSIDVEAYIRKRLENAVNVAVLSNALNGAGGVAPTGLYSLITTNINTTAGALTWATAVNLETLIKSDDATEKSLAYLSDVALMGAAKTIKKDAGSGIFLYENGGLNGHKYIGSSVVPTLDAGVSHPLVFGDWSQMFTGFWGGMSFTVDPYTAASKGMIRLIVNVYNDIAVTNEKAFAINKVITV